MTQKIDRLWHDSRSMSIRDWAVYLCICRYSFALWRWSRMEKISWTYRVRNEEVLLRVNQEGNILQTKSRNW